MNRMTTAIAFAFASLVAVGTASACSPSSANGCTQTCSGNIGTVQCTNTGSTGWVRRCHRVDYNQSPPASIEIVCSSLNAGTGGATPRKAKLPTRNGAPR
ncbi:MAG: hypothetical protein ACI9U2_003609 [Bradymonadia bacterium]|jgi:hypothetical protein